MDFFHIYAEEKEQELWRSQPHRFSQTGGAGGPASAEPGGVSFCDTVLPGREGGEELWLICSHAPLKDYICKASAFNGCADSPEPVTAQTFGDRWGLKDVSARETPEHIRGC